MSDQPYTSEHEARHLARVAEDREARAHDAQQEDADRLHMAGGRAKCGPTCTCSRHGERSGT